MIPAYREELVHLRTSDGVALEGAFIKPGTEQAGRPLVLWVHGSAMHFAVREYVEIGRALARRGVPFLSVNTRGHDVATFFWKGEKVIPAGSAWERYDELAIDIGAWRDFAAPVGYSDIILTGHSLGAAKVVVYAASAEGLAGLILASPPVGFPAIPERLTVAREMVESGQGEELLPHYEGSPVWNIVSAQTVVTREVLRTAFEPVDGPPIAASIRAPVLVLYGSEEEGAEENLRTICDVMLAARRCNTMLLPGASHDYAGHAEEVADVIAGWMS